jgi:hypothetical protein
MLTLVLLTILPQVATASEVDWQIIWQENGKLREEVKIPGRDIVPNDQDWNIQREGDYLVLSREVGNWASYQSSQDKIPLKVVEHNYIIFKQTEIDISTNAEGGLFSQLNGLDGFRLTMEVPGFIFGKYGERLNAFASTWLFTNNTELLAENRLLKFTTIDGFLSAIVIFTLGLLIIMYKFFKRLKNAERIIEEEYGTDPYTNDQDVKQNQENRLE